MIMRKILDRKKKKYKWFFGSKIGLINVLSSNEKVEMVTNEGISIGVKPRR